MGGKQIGSFARNVQLTLRSLLAHFLKILLWTMYILHTYNVLHCYKRICVPCDVNAVNADMIFMCLFFESPSKTRATSPTDVACTRWRHICHCLLFLQRKLRNTLPGLFYSLKTCSLCQCQFYFGGAEENYWWVGFAVRQRRPSTKAFSARPRQGWNKARAIERSKITRHLLLQLIIVVLGQPAIQKLAKGWLQLFFAQPCLRKKWQEWKRCVTFFEWQE